MAVVNIKEGTGISAPLCLLLGAGGEATSLWEENQALGTKVDHNIGSGDSGWSQQCHFSKECPLVNSPRVSKSSVSAYLTRCCCSVPKFCLFVTPWTVACQTSLSFTTSQSLLKLMSIEPVMPSNHLILSHPLLLLHSIFPSISPSNEYSGLTSFRIDWFDLLAVQGTLKSLLQCHNSRASIFWCLAFMVQLYGSIYVLELYF